jgi:hypothetical protein
MEFSFFLIVLYCIVLYCIVLYCIVYCTLHMELSKLNCSFSELCLLFAVCVTFDPEHFVATFARSYEQYNSKDCILKM